MRHKDDKPVLYTPHEMRRAIARALDAAAGLAGSDEAAKLIDGLASWPGQFMPEHFLDGRPATKETEE